MPAPDPEKVLALLRDPGVDSLEVASATGAPREEVARAARMIAALAGVRPEEVATLPGVLAMAVARAATLGSHGEILAALAAHPDREVAKEARRGLHLLKSRGVAVPEPARPVPARRAEEPAPEPEPPCYASTVDGHGERALWISRTVPGKGVEVAQAVISDVSGLLELQVALLGRKESRGFARDLGEKGLAMGIAEMDREEALSLVASARALADSAGRRLPAGADLWLGKLGPTRPVPDLASRFPPLPEEEEREALAASGGLHELPMLRGWLADEEVLKGLAGRLDEIMVSPLYLDEQQRAERAAGTVAETVEGWLDESRRQRLASRLFAVAAQLGRAGDPDRARWAAAAARALAAGAPAARIPFARLLVEKAFPAAAAAAAPADKRDGALIVSPR
jgi:hypothetical protein